MQSTTRDFGKPFPLDYVIPEIVVICRQFVLIKQNDTHRLPTVRGKRESKRIFLAVELNLSQTLREPRIRLAIDVASFLTEKRSYRINYTQTFVVNRSCCRTLMSSDDARVAFALLAEALRMREGIDGIALYIDERWFSR